MKANPPPGCGLWNTHRRELLWQLTWLSTGFFACASAPKSSLPQQRPGPGEKGKDMQSEIDVLIVGGGPAGLTAALVLGRARKSVLVIDDAKPRHRVADGVHNYLTQDGTPPAELRKIAWQQMSNYPSVSKRSGRIDKLSYANERWTAQLGTETVQAKAVLLAVGVVDKHPNIVGFSEKWGKSIQHCPYCHGWELREKPLAVLGGGPMVGHLAPLLRGWSDDVVLLTGGQDIPPEVSHELSERKVPVYTQAIRALEGPGEKLEQIVFADGSKLAREGLFVVAEQRPVPLVASLELKLDSGLPFLKPEVFVEVDEFQKTSLPKLWAAGDCTTFRQAVFEAVAAGGRAAVAINAELTLGSA